MTSYAEPSGPLAGGRADSVPADGEPIVWTPVIPAAAQQIWRIILRPIARELGRSAPQLTSEAVERMRAELPALFPDAQAVQESAASILAHVLQLVETIERASDPRRFELPEPGLSLIRSRVRRGIPPSEIMRLYRMAQERVWQWMLVRITAAARDSADLATALELATGWLFAYTDGAMIRAEHTYQFEREDWMRSAAAAHAAAIADILAERERDAARASSRLRYDLNRHHIAVVLWLDSDRDGGDPQGLLGTAFGELARRLGAETTFTHHRGALLLAGWASRREPFGSGIFEDLGRAERLPEGVRAAVGETGHGLTGFRRGHLDAEHARRVATLIGARAETVTRYRDVAVAALCTVDREHARVFVSRVLGPLAASDENTYRLATTLAVYLEENRSRRRAADRLTVHPNTVSYRVQQAESILGRSADTGVLELQVALAMLPTLAAPDLASAPDL
ncbi:PucR family transcriptional regulator [Nocardia huaxiensis]|uniref:PucR family transcriptional regulator n=1 Tax=Nocardia huaxiensis TaxID=2755382 RepID=UPI001FD422D8|nr:helix-turn-helix domain-containing protein [Nocardia huaxiensis]